MQRIGHGAFATVYRCDDGSALKRVDLHRAKRAMLEREVALHSQLAHPHIVPLLRVEWHAETVDLYLELCDTDLGRLLDTQRRRGALPARSDARRWFAEICAALRYLHARQIMHRDLKPPNVLLKNGHVKLSDFGFSKVVVDMTATICGSPLYMAPEILQHERYSHKSDLWSLGCILYELLHGRLFYSGATIVALLAAIEARPLELAPSDAIDAPDVAALLHGLLQRGEAERWDWPQLDAHAWAQLDAAPPQSEELQFSLELDLSSVVIEDYAPAVRPLSPIYLAPPPSGLWAKTWRSLTASLHDCAELFRDAKSV
jgi:serine/threonine protein kinase